MDTAVKIASKQLKSIKDLPAEVAGNASKLANNHLRRPPMKLKLKRMFSGKLADTDRQFFKKTYNDSLQKKSYSFPSQSVQSIYIIYYNYKNLCNNYIIDGYFTFILLLLIITRLYRGLHYCHDMLFSIIFAHYLCKFIF